MTWTGHWGVQYLCALRLKDLKQSDLYNIVKKCAHYTYVSISIIRGHIHHLKVYLAD